MSYESNIEELAEILGGSVTEDLPLFRDVLAMVRRELGSDAAAQDRLSAWLVEQVPEPNWSELSTRLRIRVVAVLQTLIEGPPITAVALDALPWHDELNLALRLATDFQDWEIGDWTHPTYTHEQLAPDIAQVFREHYLRRTAVLDDARGAKAGILSCCVKVMVDAEVQGLLASLPGSPVPYVGDADDPEATNLVGL